MTFVKGKSGNPATKFKPGNKLGKGRPKRMLTKIREQYDLQGMKPSQIVDIIEVMLELTEEQLKQVFDDPNSIGYEKAIAGAVHEDIKNGTLTNIETIISRAFGRSQQKVTHEGIPGGKITVEIIRPTDED